MVKPGKCSRSNCSGRNDSSKGKKFSVYEFNPDDERVEKDSHKMLSKFRTKSPKVSNSPVNKYDFLRCFMDGATAHGNYIEKEPLEIEDSDDESVCGLVSPVLLGTPEHESSSANPPLDHVDSALSFPGARSCIGESMNSGGRGSGQIPASDQMFCVDSDDDLENRSCLQNEHHRPDFQDDCVIDVTSSSSSEFGGHEGGGSEHSSRAPSDAEAGVFVHPDFITFRNNYSTSALVTFSREYIKLEGSDRLGTNLFTVVWAISDIVMIKSFWCKMVETAFISLHLRSKGEEEAKTINNGITELNFAVCDPYWCQIQDAIESLDIRYKSTWNTVVKIDPSWSEFSPIQQKSGTSSEVCSSNFYTAFENFIYPRGDPDAVAVSMKDIELLQPASFINDTIIDFYVKYLEQHIKPEERSRFYFFNSFFFRKLADLDKESSTACEGRSPFQSVFRWTRKVNLFEKDYLFIPVNFSLHWSLVVICHPGEVAKFTDMCESPKVPCILHMDSIRGSHRGINKLIQRYVLEEWKERNKEASQDVSSNFLNLLYITPQLPQQENSYDCGLFVLHYVERFLQQAPLHFSPYSSASSFLNKDWFPPAEASSRRDHIKNIVYSIADSNAHKDRLTTDDNYSSCYMIEGDTAKRCHRDTCHGPDSCGSNYSAENFATTSPLWLRMGLLGMPQESNMVAGALGPGDSSRSLVDETCQRCREVVPVNHFCNNMSPIEEEEATGVETPIVSTAKADSTSLSRRILLTEINEVESSSESSSAMSPVPLELQDEEKLASKAVVVSDSEESCKNELPSMLSDDDALYVVEDSFELDDSPGIIKENSTTPCSRANYNESDEQEVESPYVKACHLESIASEAEEQVMAKPKCLINQKGTLARYLSKDLRL